VSHEALLKAILEELKPLDLLDEDKIPVTTSQREIKIKVEDFREIKVKPVGANVQVSFKPINPSSYMVSDGETYTLSKKERDKIIKKFYAQAVTGSAMLWVTYWL